MIAKKFICKKKHTIFTNFTDTFTINKGDIFLYLWKFNSHTLFIKIDKKTIHEETYDELDFINYWKEFKERTNTERLRENSNRYYVKHREEVKQKQRDRYKKNKESM